MTQPTERPDTPRDRRIPYYFAIFFVIFVGLDVAMAYIAIRTHPGVRQENAYEVGLKYNDVIAAADEQNRRGIKGDIKISPNNEGTVSIVLTLTEKGRPVTDFTGMVAMVRPVQKGVDQIATLIKKPYGRYGATLPVPLKGVWAIDIKGHSQKIGDYSLSKQITIP